VPGERAIALTHDGALIRCSESVLRRFWSKVDRRGPGDCWPWKAYRCRHGRTKFRLGGIIGRGGRRGGLDRR
jgi:hypothetical protein